ncbi:MAG: hypothetical protein DRH07_09415 [Deltaproteobacteria bacterium]|nr:MAG: hypothetical protein DRH07_09415 [Deltaproteobacteria bacterium]
MSGNKIELCFASPTLYPPRGGAELRFLSYLSGLRQRDINIQILSGTPKEKKLTAEDLAENWHQTPPGTIIPTEPLDGIPIHWVRLPDKKGKERVATFNKALLNYCRHSEHRPDVIQLIEPLLPRSAPALFRLKKLGIARIFAYSLPYNLPSKPLKRILRQAALRILYQQLDCVVTASAETRDHAFGLGLKNRIETIPNGVNLKRFHPVPAETKKALRASLGLGDAEKMMITVGSIIPRKGIDLLLEAWIPLAKRFPDLHLVIVGPRADKSEAKLQVFHQRLEDLIAESGAGDRVHFTGSVKNVEEYLQAADLFTFTSEREGMANAVLEAMASRLPIVMTPHIGLSPDFGRPDLQYLLVERNPEALATAAAGLLENDVQRNELAQNGRKWVEETMDLESVLDRYAALYHELAGHK